MHGFSWPPRLRQTTGYPLRLRKTWTFPTDSHGHGHGHRLGPCTFPGPPATTPGSTSRYQNSQLRSSISTSRFCAAESLKAKKFLVTVRLWLLLWLCHGDCQAVTSTVTVTIIPILTVTVHRLLPICTQFAPLGLSEGVFSGTHIRAEIHLVRVYSYVDHKYTYGDTHHAAHTLAHIHIQ